MDLKLRNDLHVSRKIWHICGVSMIAYFMAVLAPREALFYLSVAAIIIIPFDILRLKRHDLNHRIVTFFKLIIRIEEVGTLTGVSFLIVGAFLDILLFPKKVAVLAMLFTAFGDPASSTFGVLFGKDKIWGRKSLQGSLACFTVCSIVSAVYFYVGNLMIERIVLVSILGGLTGALSELVQIKHIDDNFTLPLLSGFGLWCLFAIFGGFS